MDESQCARDGSGIYMFRSNVPLVVLDIVTDARGTPVTIFHAKEYKDAQAILKFEQAGARIQHRP